MRTRVETENQKQKPKRARKQTEKQKQKPKRVRKQLPKKNKHNKPYSCKHCGKGFNQESSMYRHIRSEHQQKNVDQLLRFGCQTCKQRFSTYQTLMRHCQVDNHTPAPKPPSLLHVQCEAQMSLMKLKINELTNQLKTTKNELRIAQTKLRAWNQSTEPPISENVGSTDSQPPTSTSTDSQPPTSNSTLTEYLPQQILDQMIMSFLEHDIHIENPRRRFKTLQKMYKEGSGLTILLNT